MSLCIRIKFIICADITIAFKAKKYFPHDLMIQITSKHCKQRDLVLVPTRGTALPVSSATNCLLPS